MKKLAKFFGTSILLAAVIWCGSLIADRQQLHEGLIRLHVVANSDSDRDQSVKLQVRDGIVAYLQDNMDVDITVDQAKQWLQIQLPKLQDIANEILVSLGVADTAVVTFQEEAFPTREYDTFSLPAGVYESLRIRIGAGEGQNWWCVVFPSLCLPATSEGFADTAAGAGFSNPLTGALQDQEGYEIRFFLLDCLGRLENLFHRG